MVAYLREVRASVLLVDTEQVPLSIVVKELRLLKFAPNLILRRAAEVPNVCVATCLGGRLRDLGSRGGGTLGLRWDWRGVRCKGGSRIWALASVVTSTAAATIRGYTTLDKSLGTIARAGRERPILQESW
jgi:hypothetical protein